MRGAYYNEIDPFAAQWLRELINAGAIAPGDVDVLRCFDVFSRLGAIPVLDTIRELARAQVED